MRHVGAVRETDDRNSAGVDPGLARKHAAARRRRPPRRPANSRRCRQCRPRRSARGKAVIGQGGEARFAQFGGGIAFIGVTIAAERVNDDDGGIAILVLLGDRKFQACPEPSLLRPAGSSRQKLAKVAIGGRLESDRGRLAMSRRASVGDRCQQGAQDLVHQSSSAFATISGSHSAAPVAGTGVMSYPGQTRSKSTLAPMVNRVLTSPYLWWFDRSGAAPPILR